MKRNTSKGKLLARDRINLLIDKSSPFLELSPLAAYDMYGKDVVNSAGVVTGFMGMSWCIMQNFQTKFLINNMLTMPL
jgi:acetyl-CoA carboxylase carboxyltransferase component